MCEAGRIILDGFELRTDADVVVYPNRYSDERGAEMWGRINSILSALIHPNPGSPLPPYPGSPLPTTPAAGCHPA